MTVAEGFAANVKRLRRQAGLSQEELSFRAGVHRTQVTLMENGDRLPRLETLVKLVGGLGASANDLLDGIAWAPLESLGGAFVVGNKNG
jgi:transcriptional regulator with XRE-family HTH domain